MEELAEPTPFSLNKKKHYPCSEEWCKDIGWVIKCISVVNISPGFFSNVKKTNPLIFILCFIWENVAFDKSKHIPRTAARSEIQPGQAAWTIFTTRQEVFREDARSESVEKLIQASAFLVLLWTFWTFTLNILGKTVLLQTLQTRDCHF